MNVICLGARVIGEELAAVLVKDFLAASFSGLERHRRRLGKVLALDARDIRIRHRAIRGREPGLPDTQHMALLDGVQGPFGVPGIRPAPGNEQQKGCAGAAEHILG